MKTELKEAASSFCEMQPNLSDLHHPMDCSRLLKVVYIALQNNEEVPLDFIREKLRSKMTSELYGGTIDSFMKSCEEYINNAKNILDDAKRADILK